MTSKIICAEELPAEGSINASEHFLPRLLCGETIQGFIIAKYVPPREQTDRLNYSRLSSLAIRKIVCVLIGYCATLSTKHWTNLILASPEQFALAVTWTRMPLRSLSNTGYKIAFR
jgi:hypothetical protein